MLAYLEEQRRGLNQDKQQLEAVLLLRAEALAREQGAEDRLQLREVLLQHQEQDSRDLSHSQPPSELQAPAKPPAHRTPSPPHGHPPTGWSPIRMSHAPQRGLRAAGFTTAGASATGPGSSGTPALACHSGFA